MIDWTNEGQMMNMGQRIPIDTPEKFEQARKACVAAYDAYGMTFDADAEGDLEHRVLGGQDLETLTANAKKDARERSRK